MKTRLVALFLALLVLPLGLALWLGLRSVQDGQVSAQTQARTVWSGPLNDLRNRVSAFVQSVEESLRRADAAAEPMTRTAFVMSEGEVVQPPRYRPDGSAESFFERTTGLWEQRFWERGAGEGEAAPAAGWKAWLTAEGPAYLYWYRDARNPSQVRGFELDTWAFLSRLSAALPELGWSVSEGADRALLLRDATGSTFARWGRWEPGDTPALVTLPLASAFEGWEFRLYLAPQALGDSGFQWTVLFALVALGLAGVVGLGAWVFVRTLGASLEEAGQRVRFVNQVSHELKTPLTNILLYGELLEGSLGPETPPKTREYLEVIRGESGRLGRLITNVLSFARRDRPDAPRPRFGDWDTLIDAALKPFAPGLADRGIELVRTRCGAEGGAWDPDWVGQILGNLVSNSEKYATEGAWVEVATGAQDATVWLRVSDRGPGIPQGSAEKIFQPFARLDDRLTAGAAGTGLGLGIARDLARRHGGDLVLEPGGVGARFLLTLPRGEVPT